MIERPRSPSKKAPIRRTLDKTILVAEATALVDLHGFESLNLAMLAARVGVKPPSLYNHIQNLEDLRRLVRIAAMDATAKEAGEAAMGRAGRDAMLAMAHALRRYAREHPGLWAALQPAPNSGDPELVEAARRSLRPYEMVLEPLGLPRDEVIHLLRAFRSLIHGFATLEAQGGFGLPTDLDKSFAWALEAVLPID